MIKIGSTVGKYEILEQIGRGAAGSVFKAQDHFLDEIVCIKALHPQFAKEPAVVERFKRELIVARKISHPGVCKAFDITEHDGEFLLVMEFVPGVTLASILNQGSVPVDRAVRLMRETAAAIGAAHDQGIVHRDLKPGNIIVTEGPDGLETVKVVDFGVAALEGSNRLTRPGVMVGSLSYIAPEVWEGQTADVLADIWALGVILYGCVTGTLPYRGQGFAGIYQAIRETTPKKPSEINPEVPAALEDVISRSMAIERGERFQRTQEFIDALDAIAAGGASDGFEARETRTELVSAPTLAPSGELQIGGAALNVPVTALSDDPSFTGEVDLAGARPLPDAEEPPGPSDSAELPDVTATVDINQFHTEAPAEVSGIQAAVGDGDGKTVEVSPELAAQVIAESKHDADNPLGGDLEAQLEAKLDDMLDFPTGDAAVVGAPLDETQESTAIVGQTLEEDSLGGPIIGSAVDEPTPQTGKTQVVRMDQVDGFPGDEDEPKKKSAVPLMAAAGAIVVVLLIIGVVVMGGGDDDAKPPDDPNVTSPGDETPGDDKPGDDTPGDDTPGDDTPGDDKPGDDTPGDDKPGDDTPGDDKPGDDTPGDDKPGDDKPLDEPLDEPGDSMDFGNEDLIDDPTEPGDAKPDEPAEVASIDTPRPAGNPARTRYNKKRRAVASLAASLGFIGGDVPAADRARSQATKAAKRGDYAGAVDKLNDAERALRSTKVDQAFVTKKLQRFNSRYDRASAAKKKKVAPMVKSVGQALAAGKYKAANAALNKAMRALR